MKSYTTRLIQSILRFTWIHNESLKATMQKLPKITVIFVQSQINVTHF